MARKWVQGEALPVHAAILVSAASTARKWVQGETLPAASCGDSGLSGQHGSQMGAG